MTTFQTSDWSKGHFSSTVAQWSIRSASRKSDLKDRIPVSRLFWIVAKQPWEIVGWFTDIFVPKRSIFSKRLLQSLVNQRSLCIECRRPAHSLPYCMPCFLYKSIGLTIKQQREEITHKFCLKKKGLLKLNLIFKD